jgi:hypothetical protein
VFHTAIQKLNWRNFTLSTFELGLVSLLKRWCYCWDYETSQLIVIEIGLYVGFLDEAPDNLTSEQRHIILEYVKKNYRVAYLTVIGRKYSPALPQN